MLARMPSTTRTPAWLLALLAAALVLYTDDYVIAGVLPELAADLAVSEAAAGQLVTVFSLTVALAAPVAAVLLARVPRRRLFAAALLVFASANLAAAATPSFALLLGWRVLAALAAASMTPALFAYAARHAPPGRVGRFIAIVSLGVTGSIALGVPLGTWIGGALGWRSTFAVMALAGLAALVALWATLPRPHDEAPPSGLGVQLRTLSRAPISLGLLATGALMTGSMMMLTYLAPYLAAVGGSGIDERAVAFGLAGVAGMLGIWLGGVALAAAGPGVLPLVAAGFGLVAALLLAAAARAAATGARHTG